MMQQTIGILLGVFLICVIAGSYFARQAVLALDDKCKLDLATIVARLSMVSLVIPLVTAAVYAAVVIMNPDLLPIATVCAFGVLVAHGIVGAFLAERAYRTHHFPVSFIRLFRISRVVRILGSAVMFAGVIAWMYTRDHS
ncbi:MAG: hypothetical protein EXS17_02475 [Phycisphaerales bacterium]|nr:hypothetical protein [Phycisphaerales bacterium]